MTTQPGSLSDTAAGHNLFGEDVAAYRDGRPGYPDALFDLLAERCGLGACSDVLEIGPGTGQATRGLIQLGVASLTSVEPDPRLAGHLADAFADEIRDRRLRLIVSRFEDAPLPAEGFDAAVAASSFHWVDPLTGLPRVKALLRPGGHLAIWWNVFHDMSGATAWSRAIRPLFDALVMPPSFVGDSHYSLDVPGRTRELAQAGFSDVRHALFRQPVRLTAPRVRAFYASFSPVLRLSPPERSAWLERIGQLIDLEFGGVVDHEVLTSLYTCRKS